MIYVASRTHHAPMWRSLRREGIPIVSTWIDKAEAGQTACMSVLWVRILAEVKGSLGLVLYMRPDDIPLKGAFVEVGAALAFGRPVCVVAPGCSLKDIGSWFDHPNVELAGTVQEAYGKIKLWHRRDHK